MSRGHGSTQRAILAYLAAQPRRHTEAVYFIQELGTRDLVFDWPGWVKVSTLARDLAYPADHDADDTPTRAQIESSRRAVLALARQGLAEVGMRSLAVPVTGTAPHTARRRHLAVRPVLTAEERAAEEQASREAEDRWQVDRMLARYWLGINVG